MARKLALLLLIVAASSCAAVCLALPVDEDVSAVVARNWVRYVEHQQGHWGMATNPQVHSDEHFILDDDVLGFLYRVTPLGYVVVPAHTELAPVTAYSETTHLPSRMPGGFFDMLMDNLDDKSDAVAKGVARGDHPAWALLTLPPEDFDIWLLDDPEWESVGPIVQTQWHQVWPFNLYCPMGDEWRTYVGCVGAALAQVLRHHEWPRRGQGGITYWWEGDTHCGDDMDGHDIDANFMVPYDWDLMPDTMNWLTPVEQMEAVSELCFNAAAAIRTDFSVCGSSASLSRATSALINYFDFEYGAREYPRFRYSDAAWFEIIRDDIDADRPIIYASTIHAMVCDGWRESLDMQQIHLNYGWSGDSDNWYCLDEIETSLNPMAERMVAGIRPGNSVQTLVPELSVARDGDTAVLTWGDGSANTSAGFHVWRGTAYDRERLTELALAGLSTYVWTDPAAPSRGDYYWLEMSMGGLPDVWIGPAWLPPDDEEEDVIFPEANPNPFNPMTSIAFALPRDANVSAEIYDLAGRRIEVLCRDRLTAGEHRLVWNGRDSNGRHAPSGRYLLRLAIDGQSRTLKLTLTR